MNPYIYPAISGSILVILVGFILINPLSLNFKAEAQEPTDRLFLKDFCASETTILDGIKYTDGTDLSYVSGDCPVSQKLIRHWDNLSIANQQIITNRLATQGYIQQAVSPAGR